MIREGLAETDVVRIALGMYSLYRVVNHYRHADVREPLNYRAMLVLFARRGADGSRAERLLMH